MRNPRDLSSNYRFYHLKKDQTRKKTVQASEDIMFQLVKKSAVINFSFTTAKSHLKAQIKLTMYSHPSPTN